ncbi:MAG: glyceraldehyde-3-phosphate dehydrogenase [Gammaproteobacteria bacterium]|nr:glyceraldehyde-3-phosphate dehydrogenase [Gammaproteobacteria bacterium]
MTNHDTFLDEWKRGQELAEQMVPLLGRLYRDAGIVPMIYGRNIANSSTIDILKAHRFVRQFEGNELAIEDSFPLLEALSTMNLSPARVDLGKLTVRWLDRGRPALDAYLAEALAEIVDQPPQMRQPKDVVLYGFGRIGRLLARMLIERTGGGSVMRLRAIVVRKGKGRDLHKRASLLRRDSVHGPFNGTITVDEEANAILANGNVIRVIYSDSPDSVDYTAYGIKDALIVDNTGIWKDEEGLGQHLKCPGASRVLLTAPAKGGIKNIVYGVNDGMLGDEDRIVSAASCTTNAITPVLKAINDHLGIVNGHVETVHSYTNDQNLIDNYHKADRRGRAAALNMVITSTGAAKAVAKALPELEGKLTGNAIRVPTPNVSLAILNLNLASETDRDGLNAFLSEVALFSDLQEQIDYTASTELVSSDLVGSRHAGVIDAEATIAEGKRCTLYVWYDNESGYSSQVVRLMRELAGIRYPNLPHDEVEPAVPALSAV